VRYLLFSELTAFLTADSWAVLVPTGTA